MATQNRDMTMDFLHGIGASVGTGISLISLFTIIYSNLSIQSIPLTFNGILELSWAQIGLMILAISLISFFFDLAEYQFKDNLEQANKLIEITGVGDLMSASLQRWFVKFIMATPFVIGGVIAGVLASMTIPQLGQMLVAFIIFMIGAVLTALLWDYNIKPVL